MYYQLEIGIEAGPSLVCDILRCGVNHRTNIGRYCSLSLPGLVRRNSFMTQTQARQWSQCTNLSKVQMS